MKASFQAPKKKHDSFSEPERYFDKETEKEIWISYKTSHFKDIKIFFDWNWIPEGYDSIPERIVIDDFSQKQKDLIFVKKRVVTIHFKWYSDFQNFVSLLSEDHIMIYHEDSFALEGEPSWHVRTEPLVQNEKT